MQSISIYIDKKTALTLISKERWGKFKIYMQNLYTENYKTVLKEIKDLKKLKYSISQKTQYD